MSERTVEIIVNGQPVFVIAGPIRNAIAEAIRQSGQIGAPIDQWVLRTRDGEVIPHQLPDGCDFALVGGQRLFLHLGPPIRDEDHSSIPDRASYQRGYAQAQRDIADWLENQQINSWTLKSIAEDLRSKIK